MKRKKLTKKGLFRQYVRNSSSEMREAIFGAIGASCVYCGSIENLEINHILPVEWGGTNSLGNFEPACEQCHIKITWTWRKNMPKKHFSIRKCVRCGKMKLRQMDRKGDHFCKNCRGKETYG